MSDGPPSNLEFHSDVNIAVEFTRLPNAPSSVDVNKRVMRCVGGPLVRVVNCYHC